MPVARKKRHEEHENHERWLVSYADFITLLFAFFTSMYAMSSVNEGKFRILSESLAVSFNPSLYTSTKMQDGPRFVREQRPSIATEFKDVNAGNYKKIQTALSDLEREKKLTFIVDNQKIVIRISETSLFEPSSDVIAEGGYEVLSEVGAVLKDMPSQVRIEGHTDNIPMNTERFPTNWDLSSARALKVLKYFIDDHSFDPTRLSAVGHGEYRPVDTNDTPTGRAKNRRVDIMIMNGDVPI